MEDCGWEVLDEGRGRYSLADVLAAERWAWARHGEECYHFNGISLWHRTGGAWQATFPDEVPELRWWHRDACNCALCRDAGERGT